MSSLTLNPRLKVWLVATLLVFSVGQVSCGSSSDDSPSLDDDPVPATVKLPRTGQIITYRSGDDGDWQAGVAWPDPRFTDNEDGTVTDYLTGLVWLQNANCFGQLTWASALDNANSLAEGKCGLSDGSEAGNWRLPNVSELLSLIDYGRWLPSLPEDHPFSGLPSDNYQYYWSSTTNANSLITAWILDFDDGYVSHNGKTSDQYYGWAVRDGLTVSKLPQTGQTFSYQTGDDGHWQAGVAWPDPRFTDNSNGTVSDNLTGLVWLQNASCLGRLELADALYRANILADGNCDLSDDSEAGDWRLPNVRELLSLRDNGQSKPALPASHPFSVVNWEKYWSSTTDARASGSMWGVYFANHFVGYSGPYVWPVRGGQI